MNMKFVKEFVEKREKELKKIDFYFKILKKNARKVLGKDTKIFVFGSFARKKDFNPFSSDVDILIFSPKVKNELGKKVKVKEAIEKNNLPTFFEIHLANEETFSYYKFFCKELKEI